MAELTKKEIQAQLKKLGINSSSELHYYSKEYREYSNNNRPSHSTRTLRTSSEIEETDQYTLARRFAQTCRSLFPVIGNFFTPSRVKAYKKIDR
jgi:hypothetical protein